MLEIINSKQKAFITCEINNLDEMNQIIKEIKSLYTEREKSIKTPFKFLLGFLDE